MPIGYRKKLGARGEDMAVDYLRKNGYKIIERNWRNKWGEIDIVAKKGGTIIFCEVKTIRHKPDFMPEDEITQKKERQLCKTAQLYLSAHKLPLDMAQQIDILAIEIDEDDQLIELRHHQNAIENY